MKKLILYNHLGEKEKEFDVFVEGQDFATEFYTPTCIWLGKILIVDKEPEPEFAPVAEPITPEEAKEMQEEIARDAAREQAMLEEEERERQKEVTEVEPETVGDKGVGESRVSEAEQPPGPETPVKKRVRRKSAKGSKRMRDPKTA